MNNLPIVKHSEFFLHHAIGEMQKSRQALIDQLKRTNKGLGEQFAWIVMPALLSAGLSAAVVTAVHKGDAGQGLKIAGLALLGAASFVLLWYVIKWFRTGVSSSWRFLESRFVAVAVTPEDKSSIEAARTLFNEVTVNEALAAASFLQRAKEYRATSQGTAYDSQCLVCIGESVSYLKKAIHHLAQLFESEEFFRKVIGCGLDGYRITSLLKLLQHTRSDLIALVASAGLAVNYEKALKDELGVLNNSFLANFVATARNWCPPE